VRDLCRDLVFSSGDKKYREEITTSNLGCDFKDDDRKGTYYLNVDVLNFELTQKEIEKIINRYGGRAEIKEGFYGGYRAYSDINANILIDKANDFSRDMKKFTLLPNKVWSDSLEINDKYSLKDTCEESLKLLYEAVAYEKINLFVLNNMVGIEEGALKEMLEILFSNREAAKTAKTDIEKTHQEVGVLKIDIHIEDTLPDEAG